MRVVALPMSRIVRTLATDETYGLITAMVGAASGPILRAVVLGADGGELTTAIQIALLGDLSYTTLPDGMFSHPPSPSRSTISPTPSSPGDPSRTASALAARDVVHRYHDVVALDGVNVDVPAGGALALVGESGSGKTTLLRCFNRMVEPTAGTVTVDGTDVRAHPAVALRRRTGYVPQDGGLLPHWRVLRNVALVPTLLGLPDPAAAAVDVLALVGMPAGRYGARFPHELSGGQRQRVALARALAARPGVILLDEPFGAVDAITRADLQAAFADVRRELGVTTLLVTHDLAEAARLADVVAVMRAGRVEQQAAVHALLASPATDYVAALFARALATAASLRSA